LPLSPAQAGRASRPSAPYEPKAHLSPLQVVLPMEATGGVVTRPIMDKANAKQISTKGTKVRPRAQKTEQG
jgi:hypothetical protein